SDVDLYRAVLTGAKCGDNKCNDFIERIRLFKQKSIVMPVSQFINYLVYDTEIFSIISSLDNSNHRRKNVYFLLNLAKNSTDNGIGAFVELIRSLPDDTFATTDNDDASVKIMTMHKSKGLQFPICIVANLSKEFNTDDFKGKYMMSDKYGFTFKPYIEDNNAFLENCGIELAKIEERTEFIAERIRLLYVALTRAEEKLVLVTGLVKKPGISSIAEKLIGGTFSPYNVNRSHSFGQMVLSVCLMHPDADKLRELAGVDLPCLPTKSKLNVIICDGCDDETKSDDAPEFVPEEKSDLIEMIRRNIAYQYPNEKLSGILAKTSVSALSHSSVENEYSFTDRPSFMNEDGISAPERGTAVHKIMQFIDFTPDIDIESEIERLVEWRFITEKEGEIADRRKLKAFFDSALYQRVLRSSDIKREMRFLTEIKAGEIGDVPPEFYDKQVIVQGAVDLLFFEDDGIVIVDFKTDRVDDPEKLRELYSEQLKLYATACSKKFERPVKELIIYSFALSKEIKLQS
ncbi:MAG: PD-(D/E)XK nuclease family protein, partial [Clostridia bacterium]|nr:PD-(D/E)XK nuclease family protein [Clostridia bacterium]